MWTRKSDLILTRSVEANIQWGLSRGCLYCGRVLIQTSVWCCLLSYAGEAQWECTMHIVQRKRVYVCQECLNRASHYRVRWAPHTIMCHNALCFTVVFTTNGCFTYSVGIRVTDSTFVSRVFNFCGLLCWQMVGVT